MIEYAILEAEKKLRRELKYEEVESLKSYVREDLSVMAIEYAVLLGSIHDRLEDAA
ncbi:hypothetical protein PH7735_01782 [Shimia thalassica]|uniref:Uncharacterized protein n=1 Tax=Shimia thalassica TaxID=1715693 RepID=A0A0N7M950_9RHOB|nr:hypothetical protein [Shimia thalassica]CUJ94744.1 hypothetical protein PH7735_01782 [Shimia thalassica]